MKTLAGTIDLAHQIGLIRIALVVDRFYDQLRRRPELAEPFHVMGNCPGRKACVTYFWWVALGGNQVAEIHVAAEPVCELDGAHAGLERESLGLFRGALFSVVDGELAEAWWNEAARMSSSLTIRQDEGRTAAAAA
jgi:truncated hemoglobin YjbI